MKFESAPANQNEQQEQFENRKREIAGAARVRLGSALTGDLSRYTDAYRRIAELEIEAHTASIEQIQGDQKIPEADKPNTIAETERNIAKLRDFLEETSDESKMRDKMERDGEKIKNGEGIVPEGAAGGWFASAEILRGKRIARPDSLDAFLDEELALKS